MAKVFERIVYNQFYEYLTENNLIPCNQSGFRSLHSTATSLLEATDNWAFNIDKGNVNAVIFLDLKKAFDTVDHSILLSKLKAYGVGSNSSNWFKSYLDNRTQKCFVNGSLLDSQPLTCGIPQGTILGPLLFILCINDLPNFLVNSHARMYADDTHLTFANVDVDDLFARLGWQKLNLQRELKTATMVYKSLNGLAPGYLKSMFTDRSATSTYSLKNCVGKLALPLPRTNFLKIVEPEN